MNGAKWRKYQLMKESVSMKGSNEMAWRK